MQFTTSSDNFPNERNYDKMRNIWKMEIDLTGRKIHEIIERDHSLL